jgi:hypothetical protein
MLRDKLIELQEMYEDEVAELEEKAEIFWRIGNPEGSLPYMRVDHIMSSGVWFYLATPGDDERILISWAQLGLDNDENS